jgi:DNA-binding CsgD family transcriptional regulator/tetratricopeptide (TPR) repeat protein
MLAHLTAAEDGHRCHICGLASRIPEEALDRGAHEGARDEDVTTAGTRIGAGEGIRPDAFIGREAELAAFRDILSLAVNGRGRAMLVDGEPGIGKSALLGVLLQLARSRGCTVLFGPADDLSQQFPMQVLLDCLGGDPAAAAPGDAPASLDQVIAVVIGLCAQSPVVLAIDDLHWADDRSLLAWRRLSELAPDLPLVVLGTWVPVPHRPELTRLKEALAAAGQAVRSLRPLAPDEVIRLVAALANGEPSERLRRLAELTGGNPLYVSELVDALARGGRLRVGDGIADIATGQQPRELASVITERLNFLSAECNRVLRFAALLGKHFTAAEVAAAAGLAIEEVALALAEAQDARVIAEADGLLSFRHLLIKQALYDGMPGALRVALHRQAAQSLAAAGAAHEQVAEQLLATTQLVSNPWAREWLAGAGPRLAQRVPRMAVELFRHAMADVPPGDPGRDQLEGALAVALLRLGRPAAAVDVGGPLLARTQDTTRRAEVVHTLGYALRECGREGEALRLIEDTLAVPALSLAWRARLRAVVAVIHALAGRPGDAAAAAQEALAEGRYADDAHATSQALHALSLLRAHQSDNIGARDLASQALAVLGGEPGSADLRSALLLTRMTACHELGDMAAVGADLLSALELVGEGDIPVQLGYAAAEHYLRAGRWDDAVEQLASVTGTPVIAGYPAPGDDDLLRRGMIAFIAGHRDDAAMIAFRQDMGEGPAARTVARARPRRALPGHAVYLVLAEALAAERDGRPEEALALLLPALSTADPAASRLRTLCLPALVRLAVAGDRADLALQAADAADQAASQEPTAIRRAIAKHCRGLAVRDPGLVLAAAETYLDVAVPLEHAQAAEDAAELLAAAGEPGEARKALAAATDGYAALGAEWDIRRADTRLRRYGVRRGRSRSPGTDSLTPTEAKIAQLIARGWSTPDIARDLLLSPRTVQTHISHILRKLNGRSRIDIARASITAANAKRAAAPNAAPPG